MHVHSRPFLRKPEYQVQSGRSSDLLYLGRLPAPMSIETVANFAENQMSLQLRG